ncbi:MAG: hypothetical protein SNJ78_13025, partial [Spirochaetales bacterium]
SCLLVWDWFLGLYRLRSLPEDPFPDFPDSTFARKKVKLVIGEEDGIVTGSVKGYVYKGSFTWDESGANSWTEPFQTPTASGQSYAEWVYESAYDSEKFRMVVYNGNDYVKLDTTMLGASQTKPSSISLDWEVKIGVVVGHSESLFDRIQLTKQQ